MLLAGWTNTHAHTHSWLSACLRGMTALQIACFLRPGFQAASRAELHACGGGGGERGPCNFQRGGVMFSYALHNGELLFSLPPHLNGGHSHSNMWQWSIWMSLTRAALRSALHSLHSLNRGNWIKGSGRRWRAPGQANKRGIINIANDIVFTGVAEGNCAIYKAICRPRWYENK